PRDRRSHSAHDTRDDEADARVRTHSAALASQGDRKRSARSRWRANACAVAGPSCLSAMATGAARLIELAFDPRVEAHDDAMSQRILDAALALVAASGFRHLTMDDVAARAGVGRMTVYRRFGSRQSLTDALAVRECRRCLNEIAAAIDPTKPIDERAVDLFAATLHVIREHPLLARLARVEPEALLYELNRDRSAVFRLVRDF